MRRINEAGLTLLKAFEGIAQTAYQDQKGVWTIGYGHTGSDVGQGLWISSQEAEILLDSDLLKTENGVDHLLEVHTNDNQFSALVCLAFNIGLSALRDSTLLRLLNIGGLEEAALEFQKWDHLNGKVIPGLSRRRLAEATLFRRPIV